MSSADRIAAAERALLAPGAPFELERADALGEPMLQFKARAPHLRWHLERSVERFGDREYLVFSDGRRFTYDDHARRVAAVARALRDDFGVRPGDRVAILAANGPEWIAAFWATVSLGAIAVGLNAWSSGDELRYALADCEPRVLIADRRRLERLGSFERVVEIESDFEALWAPSALAALPDVAIAEDDPAIILYTSGTTGRPKGVVHTHRNVNALLATLFFTGARAAAASDAAPALPRMLCTSPLFHVSGLHCAAVSCLAGGATSVWVAPRFDAEVALRLIQDERITGWAYTATVLHRLVTHPRVGDYDLSSLRGIGGGGSPIPIALQRRAKDAIPGLRGALGVGYGLTECTALATMNPGAELVDYPDSAGRALPTVELSIRDADGRELPEGVEGEVWTRSPMVMKEYWRNPDATAEAVRPGRWLRTGDIARLQGGRLYLSARKRDLILRGGENIYPAEIEHRLEEHPAVAEAAVIGVDHEELGQEVKAIVVPDGELTLDTDGLARWVGQSLAYFKVPTHWEIRHEALPRNAMGKVLRQVLRDGEPSGFQGE